MSDGFFADRHTGRMSLLRGKLIETDDSGEFQQLKFDGLKGQRMSKIGRNLPFGFTSHSPPGSIGHFLAVSGRPDQTWALGFEHPDHRKKNLGVGHTVLYNAHGDAVSLVQQNIRIVSARVDINPTS